MRLDKEQSRQRIGEIRALWREWDPIGVYSDPDSGCPPDEYDSYLGPCLRFLEQPGSEQELAKYLSYIVGEHMGLGDGSAAVYDDSLAFSKRLNLWFSGSWLGTSV